MTPTLDNFYFPPEWHPHESTWLSFPHNMETWEGQHLNNMLPSYLEFIRVLSESEKVNIIANNEEHKLKIHKFLSSTKALRDNIQVFAWGTNDSWCRDHGPSFVISKSQNLPKRIVDWGYNAWGGKYPPFQLDNEVPSKVAAQLGLQRYQPDIIMEGGSIEVNGLGDLLTSKSCLLNKNRNPNLNQAQIEQKLKQYYNVEKIHWLEEGIIGDDTDGHVDDMVRFVNGNTIVACLEENSKDENYQALQTNWRLLKSLVLANGSKPNLVSLPMPDAVFKDGIRLPASYANFYITNKSVIVPTYKCEKDVIALSILQKLFPRRAVIGIDSTEIIWGLGSFHCLSQQEPKS